MGGGLYGDWRHGYGLQRSQDRILQAGIELIYTSTRFTAKESSSSYELNQIRTHAETEAVSS